MDNVLTVFPPFTETEPLVLARTNSLVTGGPPRAT